MDSLLERTWPVNFSRARAKIKLLQNNNICCKDATRKIGKNNGILGPIFNRIEGDS